MLLLSRSAGPGAQTVQELGIFAASDRGVEIVISVALTKTRANLATACIGKLNEISRSRLLGRR